jgi:enoyl-CoA hydratase
VVLRMLASEDEQADQADAEAGDGDVDYRVTGPVGVITLNRPAAHNALNVRMIRRLAEVTEAARADEAVRAIVITGAGDKAFSAGGDLKELIPRLTRGELEILVPDPAKRFFSDLFTPVIAAVNGLCLAGGFEILLGTDIRIAADHAVFGLPEVRWGLIPGGGSHVRLPQQVPWPVAMQLLLTGEHIDAGRAAACGLVNEVVAAAQVYPRAMEIAAAIARNAPVAVRTAKEIAVRALGNEPRFALELALNERVLRSRDAREGPLAFQEKRLPDYHNR